ncbi:MAG: hypothetical protein ACXV2C_00335 [Candidatus Bathyarchaeia archaeon]
MQELKFNIGDTVWVHDGKGGKTDGKVVHIFQLDWGGPHYVVEFQTAIDPVLDIYDGFTMSDAEDKPTGFWRNLKNVT